MCTANYNKCTKLEIVTDNPITTQKRLGGIFMKDSKDIFSTGFIIHLLSHKTAGGKPILNVSAKIGKM